jgi:hypothetical protein
MAKSETLSKGTNYRVSGRTRDGVIILTPNTAPKHFTTREIHTSINRVFKESSSGRVASAPMPARDRKR